MHPKVFFKLAWIHTLRFFSKAIRWIFSCFIIEVLSILIISPICLIYLCVLNSTQKVNHLFNGNLWLLWLSGSVLVFVPMLLSVIISTIRNKQKLKLKMKEALDKKQENSKNE